MANVKAVCAAGMLTVGAAFLGYAVFFSGSDSNVPGWVPVNKRIAEAIDALPSERPKAESSRIEIPVKSAAAPPATSSLKPAQPESGKPDLPKPESQAAASPLLDLNRATQSQLETLPGVGPSKAKAIISYREQHGPFTNLKELLEVKGIGPKILEKLTPKVTVEVIRKG